MPRKRKKPKSNPRAALNAVLANGANSLLNAVKKNDERKVLELIQDGADVNFTFHNGKTPFLFAIIYKSNVSILIDLIDAGADVDTTDQEGKTALVYCAQNAVVGNDYYCVLVSTLIQKGADVNIADKKGKTALMYALQNNNETVASKLIKDGAGADLNITDCEGKTALMYVAQYNKYQLVNELIDAGADVNITDNEGKTALMYSTQNNYSNKHEPVAKLKSRWYFESAHILLMNVQYNRDHTVSMLIKAGANVNETDNKGRTALMYYAQGSKRRFERSYHFDEEFGASKKDNIVLMLIKAGADVSVSDNQGITALNYSVQYDNKSLSCALVKAGADVSVIDNNAKTALLFYSSRNDNQSVVQELVKNGIDLNVTDDQGKTSLMYALENHNNQIAGALLDAGAIVNLYDNEGKSALMYLAEYGNKQRGKSRTGASTSRIHGDQIISKLIESGADINVTDDHGKTALMYAVLNNNVDIFCALLASGADHKIIDNDGKSALFFAVINGNRSMVQALIKSGTDLNITDNQGMTVLMYAVRNGSEASVVAELIDAGANVDITDEEGRTALMCAVLNNNEDISCVLLASGADHKIIDDNGRSALFFAVIIGNRSMVQALIKPDTDLNIADNQGMTVLIFAIKNSCKAGVVAELIDAGANVNITDDEGRTALMYYAQNCRKSVVIFINKMQQPQYGNLEGNDDEDKIISKLINASTFAALNAVDNQGKTSLVHAVENRRADFVVELMDAGANVNITDNEGNNALIYCAKSGRMVYNRSMYAVMHHRRYYDEHETADMKTIIHNLIKADADLNVTNDQGKTALMYAVQNNNQSIALALIEAGADYSIVDIDGKSALLFAVINGNKSIIQELIKLDADLNITDIRGMTALMYAVQKFRVSIVAELIQAGADINTTDNEGKSALMYNAQNVEKRRIYRNIGEIAENEIAVMLIDAGADINFADDQGETALIYAVKNNNEQLSFALIDAGANVNIFDKQGNSALKYSIGTFFRMKFDVAESIVHRLIKAGANVDITDGQGRTILMFSIQCNNERLTNALIEAGAKLDICDDYGRSALIYSLQSQNESLALVLIKAGANVNMTDHKGQTALFYGVAYEKVVHALVEDGHANINKRDRHGRSVLFYAITKSLASTCYLLGKGGNLNRKDNCSMSIISFFIEHLMSKGVIELYFLESLMHQINPLLKTSVQPKAIFEALVNSIFSKIIPSIAQSYDIQHLVGALHAAKKCSTGLTDQERENIDNILLMVGGSVLSTNLPAIMQLLVELGANPNHADSDGNTALHYATCLALCNAPKDVVMTTCHTLEGLGASFNVKNHQNETPLFFCLSKKWINMSQSSSKVEILVEVCTFLQENGSSVEDTTQSGISLFHLILELFQQGLLLDDDRIGQDVLTEILKLLQLFPCSKVLAEVTVNKRDANLNSPLHFWATLCLNLSPEDDSNVVDYNGFKKGLLGTIFKHLVACGPKINDRNKNDETPLHLCRSWTAVKLLLDAEANPKALNLEGQSPLLNASKHITFEGDVLPVSRAKYLLHSDKGVFKECDDNFYPDVSVEPKAFWKTVLKNNLDPWTIDNHGKSVLSFLIEKEAFDLSKALVELACEENYIQSDAIAFSLLNAICKDLSTRKQWKSILVEMILKSRKVNPISYESNKDTALHFCCQNIVKQLEFSDEERSLYYNEDATYANIAKTSVHWTIAKQLLTYGISCKALGSSGQSCLDIAKRCAALKLLLLKPVNIDEVPLVFPWTSISMRYKHILTKIARRQECKRIDLYWYHQTNIQKGSFGLVFAGMNEKDGREVAIKRIEKLRNPRPEADKREITHLTFLADCEQVVRYLSFTEDEHFCYVILELMEGNLNDYLDGAFDSTISTHFDSTKSVQLCGDALKGLNYLHEHNILHRDLKPSNILFKTFPKLCLKIADFGLSRRIDTCSTYTTSSCSFAGTRCWIAPEVLKTSSKKPLMASDVFSCGLVLHYILSVKSHPFFQADCENKSEVQINNETEANVMNDKMEGFDNNCCTEATDLMRCMLDSNQNRRPTAAEALTHPFSWSGKKKMDFLIAVGNQPEFVCSRAKRALPLSMVETDLDGNLKSTISSHPTWDDPKYVHMPAFYTEMTQKRKYDTSSVVELVRFIRNTHSHVSEDKRPTLVRKLVLEDFVFLEYFPNLVMEVFKCVKIHGWDSREEIKYQLN